MDHSQSSQPVLARLIEEMDDSPEVVMERKRKSFLDDQSSQPAPSETSTNRRVPPWKRRRIEPSQPSQPFQLPIAPTQPSQPTTQQSQPTPPSQPISQPTPPTQQSQPPITRPIRQPKIHNFHTAFSDALAVPLRSAPSATLEEMASHIDALSQPIPMSASHVFNTDAEEMEDVAENPTTAFSMDPHSIADKESPAHLSMDHLHLIMNHMYEIWCGKTDLSPFERMKDCFNYTNEEMETIVFMNGVDNSAEALLETSVNSVHECFRTHLVRMWFLRCSYAKHTTLMTTDISTKLVSKFQAILGRIHDMQQFFMSWTLCRIDSSVSMISKEVFLNNPKCVQLIDQMFVQTKATQMLDPNFVRNFQVLRKIGEECRAFPKPLFKQSELEIMETARDTFSDPAEVITKVLNVLDQSKAIRQHGSDMFEMLAQWKDELDPSIRNLLFGGDDEVEEEGEEKKKKKKTIKFPFLTPRDKMNLLITHFRSQFTKFGIRFGPIDPDDTDGRTHLTRTLFVPTFCGQIFTYSFQQLHKTHNLERLIRGSYGTYFNTAIAELANGVSIDNVIMDLSKNPDVIPIAKYNRNYISFMDGVFDVVHCTFYTYDEIKSNGAVDHIGSSKFITQQTQQTQHTQQTPSSPHPSQRSQDDPPSSPHSDIYGEFRDDAEAHMADEQIEREFEERGLFQKRVHENVVQRMKQYHTKRAAKEFACVFIERPMKEVMEIFKVEVMDRVRTEIMHKLYPVMVENGHLLPPEHPDYHPKPSCQCCKMYPRTMHPRADSDSLIFEYFTNHVVVIFQEFLVKYPTILLQVLGLQLGLDVEGKNGFTGLSDSIDNAGVKTILDALKNITVREQIPRLSADKKKRHKMQMTESTKTHNDLRTCQVATEQAQTILMALRDKATDAADKEAFAKIVKLLSKANHQISSKVKPDEVVGVDQQSQRSQQSQPIATQQSQRSQPIATQQSQQSQRSQPITITQQSTQDGAVEEEDVEEEEDGDEEDQQTNPDEEITPDKELTPEEHQQALAEENVEDEMLMRAMENGEREYAKKIEERRKAQRPNDVHAFDYITKFPPTSEERKKFDMPVHHIYRALLSFLGLLGTYLVNRLSPQDIQMTVWMTGLSGTGKSAIMQVFTKIYGQEKVGTMDNGVEEQFGLGPIVKGKLVVVAPEVTKNFKLPKTLFLTWVTDKIMRLAFKNRDSSEMSPMCKPAFCCNLIPNWPDDGATHDAPGNVYRRAIHFPCKVKVKHVIDTKTFNDRLTEDINLIVVAMSFGRMFLNWTSNHDTIACGRNSPLFLQWYMETKRNVSTFNDFMRERAFFDFSMNAVISLSDFEFILQAFNQNTKYNIPITDIISDYVRIAKECEIVNDTFHYKSIKSASRIGHPNGSLGVFDDEPALTGKFIIGFRYTKTALTYLGLNKDGNEVVEMTNMLPEDKIPAFYRKRVAEMTNRGASLDNPPPGEVDMFDKICSQISIPK